MNRIAAPALAAALVSVACVGPEPSYGEGGAAGGTGSTGTVTPKEAGWPCDGPQDCNFGLVCAQSVCCNKSCGDFCDSCVEADTGKPTGSCQPVLIRTDPLNSCENAAQACDGFGLCKQNDDESCSFPTECISGNCDQNVCEP